MSFIKTYKNKIKQIKKRRKAKKLLDLYRDTNKIRGFLNV